MIRKTFLPSFALLSASVSAQAAEAPKPAPSQHIVVPPHEAPEPEKLSGQYSCQMELIEARGLTLEQANQLLETARTPNPKFESNPAQDALDHLHREPVVRKDWNTALQEKWAKTGSTPPAVKIMSAPTTVTRIDSEKGGWIKIKSPEGSFEFANKCLAAKPDADGYMPLDLSLITGSRDANGKEILKTNKGTIRVKSGVPLLLADTPELATTPTATTNPLVMRTVPGPDYEVKFLRVSMTYISPEEIYGKPNGKRLR